jgi:kynurenine formamidase
VIIDRLVDLEGIVIRVDHRKIKAVTSEHFKNKDLKNRAVLIQTGWDVHWNTDRYYTQHPFLTKEAADYLKEGGAALVGIDSHNIDDTAGNSRPVHTTLLGAEILIVEHLCNLSALPEEEFTFSAVPPKFKGVGTFPVRALAKLRI